MLFRSTPSPFRPEMRRRRSNQLVEQALANRSEIAQSRLNIDSNKLNLVGIKNALKPTLQAFAELTNNGLTGPITADGRANAGRGISGRRLWQPAGARCSAAIIPTIPRVSR